MNLLKTRLQTHLKTKPTLPLYSAAAFAISISLLPSSTMELSLDVAVNEQLGLGPLPCAELLAGFTDNTDRLTGGLLTICSALVPAGSIGDSAGGGSATAISTPTIMQNVVDTAYGDNGKDKGLFSITKNWGIFFTAEAESLNRETSDFAQGFKSDRDRFIFGSSYTASAKRVYRVAFDINRLEGDYNGGGEFENSSQGIRLLGSFRPFENSFINVLGGFDAISTKQEHGASFDYSFNGASAFNTSGAPGTVYDYEQYGISINVGHDYRAGQYTFSPTLGFNWNKTDYGTYSEAGNSGLELTFYDNEEESLQTTIGINTSASLGTSFGAFKPQLGLT
jgi:hypothetical protein